MPPTGVALQVTVTTVAVVSFAWLGSWLGPNQGAYRDVLVWLTPAVIASG
jgi:hypothetical protein